MNKESRYDQITGEWEPEEWSEDDRTYNYPPRPDQTEFFKKQVSTNSISPNGHGTVKLPNGDLFRGFIYHITPEMSESDESYGSPHTQVMYTIYGRSKTLEEARKRAQEYSAFHHQIASDGNLGDISYQESGPPTTTHHSFWTYNRDRQGHHITTTGFSLRPIPGPKGEPMGYEWSQTHFTPYMDRANKMYHDEGNPEAALGSQKSNIEYYHHMVHDMASRNMQKTARYDQVTGDWVSEEWGEPRKIMGDTESEYPKNEERPDKVKGDTLPEYVKLQNQKTSSLPDGTKFLAKVVFPSGIQETRDPNNYGYASIYGISGTAEEALKKAKAHTDAACKLLAPRGLEPYNYNVTEDGPEGGGHVVGLFSRNRYVPLRSITYIRPVNGHWNPEDFSSVHAYGTPNFPEDDVTKNPSTPPGLTPNERSGYYWVHHLELEGPKINNLSFEGHQSILSALHQLAHDTAQQWANPAGRRISTKIYSFADDGSIKVSDRMSPEELGPEFSGIDQQEQNVGTDVDNQPRGVSETIPSSNSFFTHDTLAFKTAEVEDMNYEGVGSLFGQGMGPQDFSSNAADVEEGPKEMPRTEKSPGALQGQAVLPDVTSWYTASKLYDDDEYDFYTDDWEPL